MIGSLIIAGILMLVSVVLSTQIAAASQPWNEDIIKTIGFLRRQLW